MPLNFLHAMNTNLMYHEGIGTGLIRATRFTIRLNGNSGAAFAMMLNTFDLILHQ